MSRIGKKPVELPGGVSATLSGQTVEIKGPKGVRSFTATDDVTITLDGNEISVKPRGLSKRFRHACDRPGDGDVLVPGERSR